MNNNQIYKTNKIFTPTSPAIDNFVERPNVINRHLVDALNTPGKQIVLYGHSGCGKSTLLINKLNQVYESYYITRCSEDLSYEQILLNGFDQLAPIYKTESQKKKFNIAPEISFNYDNISASFKLGGYSSEKNEYNNYIIPPQLTPQKLATFFGASNSCWILEDFHKVKTDDKKKISQMMKIFMDMSFDYSELKIIALGAVGTARQVVEYDIEMKNRIAEIFVPYMQDEEIELIIQKGESLLNIIFVQDVKDAIVKYSCGLPSICHQLCLNICFNKNIYQTEKKKKYIHKEDLDLAIKKLLEEKSDSLKKDYDRAVRIEPDARNNIPQTIIKACLELDKDEFSREEILDQIGDKRINTHTYTKYLKELCSSERSEILIYDSNSNLYQFSNLFFKGYAYLILKDSLKTYEPKWITPRDKQIIDRLLEIVDHDVYNDLGYDRETDLEDYL